MNAFAVIDPTTGESGPSYPTATDAQLADAVARTAAAYAGWSARSVGERAAVVRRTALDGLIAHRHDPRLRPLINAFLASASDTDRPSIRARRDYLGTVLGAPG